MNDLVAFLTARYDEDEAAALACESPSPWRISDHPSASSVVDDANGEPLIYNEGSPSEAEAAHIARHDPARVLREVQAKRKILAEHPLMDTGTFPPSCDRCWDGDTAQVPELWPCLTVRALAAVYSDHDGYKQEWA